MGRKAVRYLKGGLLALTAICLLAVGAVYPFAENVIHQMTGITDNTLSAYSRFYPNTDIYNTVCGNQAETGYGEVLLSEEKPAASDCLNTWYYGQWFLGPASGFYNITCSSSNPDVATATAVSSLKGLRVNFSRGSAAGTAEIRVGFSVSRIRTQAGLISDDMSSSLVNGELVYTVTNKVRTYYYGLRYVEKLDSDMDTVEVTNMPSPNPSGMEMDLSDVHTMTVSETVPVREGYVFKGWKYISKIYQPGDSIVLYGNPDSNTEVSMTYVLYAVWEKINTYTVVYTDGFHGAAFPDDVHEGCVEGSPTPACRIEPVREGYMFMGWAPQVHSVVDGDFSDDGVTIQYVATWKKQVAYYVECRYTDEEDNMIRCDIIKYFGNVGEEIFGDALKDLCSNPTFFSSFRYVRCSPDPLILKADERNEIILWYVVDVY